MPPDQVRDRLLESGMTGFLYAFRYCAFGWFSQSV